MNFRSMAVLITGGLLFAQFTAAKAADPPARPLKALLITGGCCHDYERQLEILRKGIQARANVQVDVYWTKDKSTAPPLPLYDDRNWAASYDVIIHDECAANVKDMEVVKRILDAHQKVPSVNLHCAMHCYRTGTDDWFKYLGLQSSGHGPQEPIEVRYVDKQNPITKGLEDWTTIKEELYNNVNVFGATPLAYGRQTVKKNGMEKEESAVVVWTNEIDGVRSFSTTLGHNNETVADDRYLNLVTRGLLWSCGKLEPAYLMPFSGEGKMTVIEAPASEEPKARKEKAKKEATAEVDPPATPATLTPATVTPSTTSVRIRQRQPQSSPKN